MLHLYKKNLLSVSQFSSQNNASIEFFPHHFLVKDLSTGASLVQGRNRGYIYEWPRTTHSPVAYSSTKTTFDTWHQRLGHPASTVLQKTISTYSLPVHHSSSPLKNCDSFLCNKSHHLPFGKSSIKCSQPLELLYTDVWGPALILSFDNYRFYIIFVDYYTKYTWFLKKSDVSTIYHNFKITVENYFCQKIKIVYSDGGGEYQGLTNSLVNHGIQHLKSPPYTPQLVGTAERKHRHRGNWSGPSSQS